jgi:prepilin-type N-terminal cleavage/methylation domain-containing protein
MWVKQKQTGFTIVELLIVIVVIGILAAITTVAYNGIQLRTRDTIRVSDLRSIHKSIELYKAENGSYPLPANGSLNWTGNCVTFGSVKNYITGISAYVSSSPLDPKWKDTDNRCYLYRSNGVDFMILAWNSMENICGGDPSNACNPPDIRALDRPAASEPSIAIYSPGASGW